MISDIDSQSNGSGYRVKGKVANLPHALREQVNARLHDGHTYSRVVEWLQQETGRPWNEENISNWHSTGYQAWLKARESIEHITQRRDAALAMVRSLKSEEGQSGALDLTQANELLLASQINEILCDFDPGNLKALLADDPKKFFQLASSIASQSNVSHRQECGTWEWGVSEGEWQR